MPSSRSERTSRGCSINVTSWPCASAAPASACSRLIAGIQGLFEQRTRRCFRPHLAGEQRASLPDRRGRHSRSTNARPCAPSLSLSAGSPASKRIAASHSSGLSARKPDPESSTSFLLMPTGLATTGTPAAMYCRSLKPAFARVYGVSGSGMIPTPKRANTVASSASCHLRKVDGPSPGLGGHHLKVCDAVGGETLERGTHDVQIREIAHRACPPDSDGSSLYVFGNGVSHGIRHGRNDRVGLSPARQHARQRLCADNSCVCTAEESQRLLRSVDPAREPGPLVERRRACEHGIVEIGKRPDRRTSRARGRSIPGRAGKGHVAQARSRSASRRARSEQQLCNSRACFERRRRRGRPAHGIAARDPRAGERRRGRVARSALEDAGARGSAYRRSWLRLRQGSQHAASDCAR